MRPIRLVSLILVGAAVGVAATTLLVGQPQRRALRQIVSSDAADRQAGWTWLLEGDGHAPPAEGLWPRIHATLESASDAALLDAALTLRRRARWGWRRTPAGLVLREATLLADGTPPDDELLAAETMHDAPLDLDAGAVTPVLDRLLGGNDRAARRVAMEAALGWLGPDRGPSIGELAVDAKDVDARRTQLLALGLAGVAPPVADESVDLLEATLLAGAMAGETAETAIELQRDWTGEPRPAFEYILRQTSDPAAGAALERAADAGDHAALYALQARRRSVDDTQSRRLLDDRSAATWRRRIASWRWPGASLEQVRDVLGGDPTDPDGSVYATALLAERRLPPGEAAKLAATWIGDLNDDRKRAGALLAALLGVHREALLAAYEREDVGAVRTTQRLALLALGHDVGPEDSSEFAYRTLHRSTGDFNPDTALCLLLTGTAETPALLATRPIRDAATYRESVQQRAWLIERFVPAWYDRVGRPIGVDPATVDLHFDLLRAAWLLDRRRMAFDDDAGHYVPAMR